MQKVSPLTICLNFALILFALGFVEAGVSASLPEHTISFYHDEEFITPQEQFFAFDTIYAVIDLENLTSGEHKLSIDWQRPDGKLVRNSTHSFSLAEKAESYRAFFWLKLHPRGPIRQLVSGGEYPASVYGSWKVKVSLNGISLNPGSFVVVDEGF